MTAENIRLMVDRLGSAPWTPYAIALVGAAALYCLLPRTGRGGQSVRGLGQVLGLAALAGLVVWMVVLHGHRMAPPMEHPDLMAWFHLFAVIALIGAAVSMTDARPIYCALYFVLTILSVAAILVLLVAPFLAIALILIYAGAILVLYVFVIMMASSSPAKPDRETAGGLWADGDGVRSPAVALLLSFLLLAGMGSLLAAWPTPMEALALRQDDVAPAGTTEAVGIELFRRHLVSLELAGVLLLVAVVGAVALVRRRVTTVDKPGSDSRA